jgi:hypothetical protein
MSSTPRELEITIKTETPSWLQSLNEYRLSQQSNANTTPTQSFFTHFGNITKKTLFWSGVGAASSFVSLLIGRLILDNTGYSVKSTNKSLEYAAIGGAASYFLFRLITEISKKCCCPPLPQYAQTSSDEEQRPENRPNISLQKIALYSLLLNLGGTFLGVVLLQNYPHFEKAQDDVIASTVGAGVLFASVNLINGLRSC